MYLNQVLLFGNLTRDPEVRAMPSGLNVTSFSIATNRVFKDRDGKKQEQVEFHNIVVFGRQADTVAQYLKKGSSAFIEGRLQTRSWDDKKTGEKKYRTEIVAERVQFGPRGGSGGGGGSPPVPSNSEQGSDGFDETPSSSLPPAGPGIDYPKEEINPDDIPF